MSDEEYEAEEHKAGVLKAEIVRIDMALTLFISAKRHSTLRSTYLLRAYRKLGRSHRAGKSKLQYNKMVVHPLIQGKCKREFDMYHKRMCAAENILTRVFAYEALKGGDEIS